MALTGLHSLGVVLLLNVVVEISGSIFPLGATVEIPTDGLLPPMEPCTYPNFEFDVEFHKIAYNTSTTYKRWVIREAALNCFYTIYGGLIGYEDNVEDCLKHAVKAGFNTFFLSDGECGYIDSSIAEEFMTCNVEPSEYDYVIYTTSARPEPYDQVFPGNQEFVDCDVEVRDTDTRRTIRLDVDVIGNCNDILYLVTYNSDPGEAYVTRGEEYELEEPLPACQMVNFTIQHLFGRRPANEDTCVATVLLGPGDLELEDDTDFVIYDSIPCEIITYKITFEIGSSSETTDETPLEGPIKISKTQWAGASYTIEFFSDMDIDLPTKIQGII